MKPQDLYLQLIEAAGQWNALHGSKIASSLRANRYLWLAVVFCDRGYHLVYDLEGNVTVIQNEYDVLRGLPDDALFLDTLRIAPQAGREGPLEALAAAWDADTAKWLTFAEASSAYPYRREEARFAAAGFNPSKAVLEVWWN